MTPEQNQQLPLFVYGTLMPGLSRYKILRPWVDRHEPAMLSGFQMYDFRSFPGIYPSDNEDAPDIPGYLLYVQEENWPSFIDEADKVENNGFLFIRTEVNPLLMDGSTPSAWCYTVNPKALRISPDIIIKNNSWHSDYR